jgi:hypothetical protein
MVLRSMPASRRRKLSVPSTSSSGRPAEKPSVSMRRLAGSRYTRSVWSQDMRGAVGEGVVVGGMGCGVLTIIPACAFFAPLLP